MQDYPVVVIPWLFTALLVCAGVYDVRQRRVPNWLNFLILAIGAYVGIASERSFGMLILTLLVAFGAILPFFHFRVYRGGDAKLLIACGAWFDVWTWLVGFAVGMALGALWALVIISLNRKEREASVLSLSNLFWSRFGTLGEDASNERPTVPMAVSFGLAMILANNVDVLKWI